MLAPMLVAVAIGGLAAAWLQELTDKRARRRRAARALAVDAALWEAEEETCGVNVSHASDRLAKATADARVDAAVRRAAAAEAAAAEAEEAAASYRDAYLAACAPEQTSPPSAELGGASPHDVTRSSGGDAAAREGEEAAAAEDINAGSAAGSDAEWDHVTCGAPRCPRCNAAARERCALVPCGHTVCAACGERCTACAVCGEVVMYALRLREEPQFRER
jgi:hypothetical protein